MTAGRPERPGPHHHPFASPGVLSVVGHRGTYRSLHRAERAARHRSLRFGRKSDNDVVIVDTKASRLHAEIVVEDGSYVLHDRDSRNGTHVNEQRVTRHVLASGDVIRIGDETFRFETQEAMETVMDLSQADLPPAPAADPGLLRVTVVGGGPVGLAFALLLEDALGATSPSPSTTAAGPAGAPGWSGRTRRRATSAASRW